MRLAILGLALALIACGELQSGALSGGLPSPSPAATATETPAVAVRLMEQVKSMTALVRRVDRITVVRAKWGDILARSGTQQTGADPNEDVWVVAVVGEIYPSFGVIDMGTGQCGTFFYDLAGNVKGSGVSSLAGCAPYFSDSLVPSSAPIACPAEPQAYGYDLHGPTTKGPVTLSISRDDTWRQPNTAPGSFLFEFPSGSGGY